MVRYSLAIGDFDAAIAFDGVIIDVPLDDRGRITLGLAPKRQ